MRFVPTAALSRRVAECRAGTHISHLQASSQRGDGRAAGSDAGYRGNHRTCARARMPSPRACDAAVDAARANIRQRHAFCAVHWRLWWLGASKFVCRDNRPRAAKAAKVAVRGRVLFVRRTHFWRRSRIPASAGAGLLDRYDLHGPSFLSLNGLFGERCSIGRNASCSSTTDTAASSLPCREDGTIYSPATKALLRILPGCALDDEGVAEFLRFGSTLNGRTLFRGIRLLGGTAISADAVAC